MSISDSKNASDEDNWHPDGVNGSGQEPLHALSARQERRLVDYLDARLLELNSEYKKRSTSSSTLRTLPAYLDATYPILSMILHIPPIDPSTSLRTAFLLRLTSDALSAIPGYSPSPPAETLPLLVKWLDTLDRAWFAVLQCQVWDSDLNQGVDLVVPVANGWPARASPLSQTERTRLRSMLVTSASALEDWLTAMDTGGEDFDEAMERLGVMNGLEGMFERTLGEMGAWAGAVSGPDGMEGTC